LPAIEVIECNRPNRLTPAGIKGMSEGGVMGAIGALGNAVGDALGRHAGILALTSERLRVLLAGPWEE